MDVFTALKHSRETDWVEVEMNCYEFANKTKLLPPDGRFLNGEQDPTLVVWSSS